MALEARPRRCYGNSDGIASFSFCGLRRDVPADIVPCTRSEFEEEKHEIDTLARAAFLRGRRIYERSA
jgi:hypothetical protein